MNKLNYSSPPRLSRQTGVALVIALVLLIVLTLLGLSAMDTTILETKLARNNQERNYAFNAAEAGLLLNRPVFTSNTLLGGLLANPLHCINLGQTAQMVREKTPDVTMASRGGSPVGGSCWNGGTPMEYRGNFIPPAGTGSDAGSVTDQVYYFETRTQGMNLDQNGVVNVNLREGLRVGAPSGSNTNP